MKVRLSDAPGCIGSPVILARDHTLCKNCMFHKLCAHYASVVAKKIDAETDGGETSPSIVKILKPKRVIAGIGKKASTVVQSLERQKVDEIAVRRVLDADVKRAVDLSKHWTPKFFRWGVLLMHRYGTVSKNQIANEFETRFTWAHPTAQSHSTIFVDIVTHMNIATLSGGMLTQRKTS